MSKQEREFNEVIDRSKHALGVKTDSEFADAIGVPRGRWGNRKARSSIPYADLIKALKTRNISLDAIFTDQKGVAETPAEYAVSANSTPLKIGKNYVGLRYSTDIGLHSAADTWPMPIKQTIYEEIIKYNLTESCLLLSVDQHSPDDALKTGDLALVDTGINECDSMGMYVVRYKEKLHFKRMRNTLDGKLQVVSSHNDYPSYWVEEPSKVNIEGKVVCGWKSCK